MTASNAASRLSPDELRTLFLFADLTDEQLEWISVRGEVRTYDAKVPVYEESDPADYLYVLLSGALRMSRSVQGEDLTIVETAHRGSYSGAMRAFIDTPSEDNAVYLNSLATTEPSSFFLLPAPDFAEMMRKWFPMAVHLLDGLYLGIRNSESTVRQREHLARLGTLSAGLAHELNNPAAAAMRATSQLREQVMRTRHKLKAMADGRIDPAVLSRVVEVQESTLKRLADVGPVRSPIEVSDAEDELTDRLEAMDLPDAMDLASTLAGVGLDATWVDDVCAAMGTPDASAKASPDASAEASANASSAEASMPGDESLALAIRYLVNTFETGNLMSEIEEATSRIANLVGAVKQYAYMDSSSTQEIDVHVGLDSTVVILGHKLTGIDVQRDYDRTLPKIPAYAAELNQVWTNLIDNAADALGGNGVLTLRTYRDGEDLVVAIGDNGPGIPEQVRPRIFEAFFTTKPAGSGSGLGLENAKRTVVKRHHGRIDVQSSSAGTTFEIRLPVNQQLH
ncbi:MAG TPA: ATP-binding protein [Frankiaceae bacterium]|nr:ATP-binding protein [Frankiaceae bacterium]